ncbi:hypothetical protein GJ629_00585 [Halapricum sp. CBA1109]|uniref:hypothetical protein n=1 Tax=Halapricum sp. CBA1109 TaxID=2668068 RepID=UPI0012F8DAA7|nr:hypothetical protein [Halapricum sp. CBA1109]MUV88566.1 hypothetical protein [Halapricum sp. CBA1109]
MLSSRSLGPIDVVRARTGLYREVAGEETAETYNWFEDIGYGSNPMADAESYGIGPNDLASHPSKIDAFKSTRSAA